MRFLASFAARFIPAGAGNMGVRGQGPPPFPVYPRWRGEYGNSGKSSLRVAGLSPLARGIFDKELYVLKAQRFIPAGAGNMQSIPYSNGSKPVYPRWRGEYNVLPHFVRWRIGLSPLARGIY